jgi:hypothetical protein
MLDSIVSVWKRQATYKLLKIKMEPEMTIEEFQTRIDELYFSLVRDDSLLLDKKEFRDFQRAFIGLCADSCVSSIREGKEYFDFNKFYFDKEKEENFNRYLDMKMREFHD